MSVVKDIEVIMSKKSLEIDNDNFITIKQVHSGAGRIQAQIATLKGLGLNKINRVSKLKNTPEIQGMLQKVKHLVKKV